MSCAFAASTFFKDRPPTARQLLAIAYYSNSVQLSVILNHSWEPWILSGQLFRNGSTNALSTHWARSNQFSIKIGFSLFDQSWSIVNLIGISNNVVIFPSRFIQLPINRKISHFKLARVCHYSFFPFRFFSLLLVLLNFIFVDAKSPPWRPVVITIIAWWRRRLAPISQLVRQSSWKQV